MDLFGVSESALRLAAFVGIFVTLALAEARWPRRARLYPRHRRWPTNLWVLAAGAVAIRGLSMLSLPLVAVAAAGWAEQRGLGLFQLLALPAAVEFALTLLALDLLIWAQHAASHRLAWFWRLHRVHHVDRDIDASTALRFHPAEIVLSMLIKVVAVLALGAPVVAVIAFEIILNGMALFNHANLRLPESVDRLLRRVVVTPDMHRVHHSVHADEHHRNFGFSLSIWDRVFGSYLAAPRDGHSEMQIGLPDWQTDAPNRFWWSLWLPVAAKPRGAGSTPAPEPPR